MSDYMGDLSSVFNLNGLSNTGASVQKDRSKLDLEDYLQLMVAMFQNQTIDNTADISDMMNNMVQMSVVEAISSISSLIEESTALNYAASLVGKDVTVGVINNGQLIEIYGKVQATGTYNGQQVIFLEGDDGYYPITSIMAVGRLPGGLEAADGTGGIVEPEDPEEPEPSDGIEEPEEPGGIEDPEESEDTEGTEGIEAENQIKQGSELSPEELAEKMLAEQGSEAAGEETII